MRHANDKEGDQKGGAEKGRGETGAGMEKGRGHGRTESGGLWDLICRYYRIMASRLGAIEVRYFNGLDNCAAHLHTFPRGGRR